jgi:hypothetical protein
VIERVPLLATLPLLALLASCASVTAVKTDAESPASPNDLPAKFYVRDFATPAANLRADREGERLAAFQSDIATKLTDFLVEKLDRSVAPAAPLSADADLPRGNAWLITGEFDQVNQGSRALRVGIGFGAGGTKVVTTANVYDLSTNPPTPLFAVRTSGGSNAMPGLIVNANPLTVAGPVVLGVAGAIAGGGVGLLPGLTDDLRRTAREITATISAYSTKAGILPADQAMNPKKPGSGAIRFTDPKREAPTNSSR